MPLTTRLLAVAAAGLALAGATIVPGPASAAPTVDAVTSAAVAGDRTSAVERRRVDSVPTPKLKWYSCYNWGQCSTANVPLDYDRPHGKQLELALLRVKARDQKHRIGTLFVNPGGPGGSAVATALAAPYFLSDAILDRFDVVGIDPRGIGFSSPVACFANAGRQESTMDTMDMGFPLGKSEEKDYIVAAAKEAKACSTTGREMAGSMSTAEVVRDMEVMRRAVGDSKLSFLGFSYGTAIGQYYANMFPDRFRAIAVDGVIDPRDWVGSATTAGQIQDDRLRSADGAWKALAEILRRCSAAGPAKCEFSNSPMHRFRVLSERLKKRPITVDGEELTYALFIGMVLDALYSPTAGADITALAAQVYQMTSPGYVPSNAERSAAAALIGRMRARAEARSFPYDNSFDAYSAVMCTDGRHPASSTWAKKAARADRRADYLGRAWAWASVQCAHDLWTVHDEDAYTGPFNRHTNHPVLFVGSFWDPATNYSEAVKASKLLPNSRLLSSNNWGHTAYGTSDCATGFMDRYLLYRALPTKGTTCVGAVQPFRTVLGKNKTTKSADAFNLGSATPAEIAAHGLPAAGSVKVLPPAI